MFKRFTTLNFSSGNVTLEGLGRHTEIDSLLTVHGGDEGESHVWDTPLGWSEPDVMK